MEFILESQARAEARMEKWEVRMARAEARMEKSDARAEKAEARMARTDKRIESIAKLLQQGMRMLAKTDTALAELAQAQKATERTLKAFLGGSRNGPNGRRA
jgi:hypothetical protein